MEKLRESILRCLDSDSLILLRNDIYDEYATKLNIPNVRIVKSDIECEFEVIKEKDFWEKF